MSADRINPLRNPRMEWFDQHGSLPGMIAAFENHYGQCWTDKEWRDEAAIWAAAWKAALAAQPAQAAVELSDEQIDEFAYAAGTGPQADRHRRYARAVIAADRALRAQPAQAVSNLSQDDVLSAWQRAAERASHSETLLMELTKELNSTLRIQRAELVPFVAADVLDSPEAVAAYVAELKAELARYEAPPAQAVELEKSHEARRQAQAEAAALKERIARARVDLMRELHEQGWTSPAQAVQADGEDARDAARYRWLRRYLVRWEAIYHGGKVIGSAIPEKTDRLIDCGLEWDAARALAGKERER